MSQSNTQHSEPDLAFVYQDAQDKTLKFRIMGRRTILGECEYLYTDEADLAELCDPAANQDISDLLTSPQDVSMYIVTGAVWGTDRVLHIEPQTCELTYRATRPIPATEDLPSVQEYFSYMARHPRFRNQTIDQWIADAIQSMN